MPFAGTVEREVCAGQQVFKNMASHDERKVTEDISCNTGRLNLTLLLIILGVLFVF